MNSNIVLTNGEGCSYWSNGSSGMGHGRKLFFSFFFVLFLIQLDLVRLLTWVTTYLRLR
jgi:hypothetical protein